MNLTENCTTCKIRNPQQKMYITAYKNFKEEWLIPTFIYANAKFECIILEEDINGFNLLINFEGAFVLAQSIDFDFGGE